MPRSRQLRRPARMIFPRAPGLAWRLVDAHRPPLASRILARSPASHVPASDRADLMPGPAPRESEKV
jgi:hypothetical protein